MVEMNTEKLVLALDIGASNGRAMLGVFNGETIQIQEIHRFSNDPVIINGTLYWDVLRLIFEIKQSLLKAKKYGKIESIGIDTWGVDFGLLDKDGMLLENPVHYRDSRTEGMLEKSFDKLERNEFYSITGNQFMQINTVFQVLALKQKREHILKKARDMLLMPDLLNYFLTGKKVTEYSIASTTQLLDANKRIWSKRVINSLGLPNRLFSEIVPSGTVIGELSKEILEELHIDPIKVVAVAGHDTQSAMVSVPASEKDFVFLSSGTWALIGTELENPIIDDKSCRYNLTNEGAYGHKISFLKNITGLWLIQECRRQWSKETEELSFSELEKMAQASTPFKCFIDPDDSAFSTAGNLPRRIQEYCMRTGQQMPSSIGEIARCINESLALKFRYSLEQIEECTGKKYKKIYMVGGGIQNKLLCQMTANASRCQVAAGPIEATAFGNIGVQLIALKEIENLEKVREIIKKSEELHFYYPENNKLWDAAYKRFKKITKC